MQADKELIEPAKAVEFLTEAATYFARRPTGGEDAAHWSNAANAATCRRIAALISALSTPMPSREEVARKIDPGSFDPPPFMSPSIGVYWKDRHASALKKADAILGLIGAPDAG